MSFMDMLLHIDSFPDPTPAAGIDQAVEFARLVNGRVTALALSVDIPSVSNRLADYLLSVSKLEQEAEEQSVAAAREKLDYFRAKAEASGVFEGAELGKCPLFAPPEVIARRARTHDLCIVPVANSLDGQAAVAVAAVFDSGRPVLIYDASHVTLAGPDLGKVVIAWDGSRCAARALADALPLLTRAREVRLLSILDEKPAVRAGITGEPLRHLQRHGIEAKADEITGHRNADVALRKYLAEEGGDLLVMGAYGHSRAREFILGGATEFILRNPPVPVLLSH